MTLKKLTDKLLDALFDCSFAEQHAYYLEDDSFWRETSYHCQRCGKVDMVSQSIIDSDEFWEVDMPFCLSIEHNER